MLTHAEPCQGCQGHVGVLPFPPSPVLSRAHPAMRWPAGDSAAHRTAPQRSAHMAWRGRASSRTASHMQPARWAAACRAQSAAVFGRGPAAHRPRIRRGFARKTAAGMGVRENFPRVHVTVYVIVVHEHSIIGSQFLAQYRALSCYIILQYCIHVLLRQCINELYRYVIGCLAVLSCADTWSPLYNN